MSKFSGQKLKSFVFMLIGIFVVPVIVLGGIEGIFLGFNYPLFKDEPKNVSLLNIQSCRYGSKDLDTYCNMKTQRKGKSIFILGGSTAVGYPHEFQDGFSNLLQNNINKRRGGDYTVYNFAVSCKDSNFVLKCAERVLRNRPHKLILYTGHNDFTNIFHPHSMSKFLQKNVFIIDLIFLLRESSRIYNFMSNIMTMNIKERKGTYPLETMDEFKERHDFVNANFLENLEKIRLLSKKYDTELSVITPVSNLSDFMSSKRELSSKLFHDLLNQSHELKKKGDSSYGAKNYKEALEFYKRAKDIDPAPSRVTEAFNNNLRTYAKKNSDIKLIDFQKEMEALYPRMRLGCDLFGNQTYCDQFHLNKSGHQNLAEVVFNSL